MKGKKTNPGCETEYLHVKMDRSAAVQTSGLVHPLGLMTDGPSTALVILSPVMKKQEKLSPHLTLNGQETAKSVAGNTKSQLSAI